MTWSAGTFLVASLGLRLHLAAENLKLTPPLADYSNAKFQKHLDRFQPALNDAKLTLKVQHQAKHDQEHKGKEMHIAEIYATCKDSSIIRATHQSDNMYASLDALSDVFARSLRKHKEKRAQRHHSQHGIKQDFAPTEEEEDEMGAPSYDEGLS